MTAPYNKPYKAPYGSREYWQESAEQMRAMRSDLDTRKITPRQVIGTGYVGNTRKLAEQWIDEQIAIAEEELAKS